MSNDDDNRGVERNVPTALTSGQSESLQHLREIAGSIDYESALRMMEDCGWNLERAVNKLCGLPDSPSPESVVRRRVNAGTESSTLPQVDLVPPNQRILRATAIHQRGWWWPVLLLLEPVRFSYHLLVGVIRFFASFLWPDPRSQVTDPVGDVQRFISYFKSNYVEDEQHRTADTAEVGHDSSVQMPPFFEGSYAQALQEAKRSLRFLVVYLHGDSHEDTDDFCRITLRNDHVLRFLSNSEQIIFWGCNIESPEGYRVSRTLREHTYPFVGVIGLASMSISDNGVYAGSSLRMALLGRIEGAVKPAELIHQLTGILDEHQGATLTARMDRQEREATARIREEQDIAYAESLARDRARIAAHEEEIRNAALEAAQAARNIKREETLKRARSARRSRWRQCLPTAPKPNDPSTVQLSFKMPDGSRLSRVFSVLDSVKIMYYFLLSQEQSPENFEIQSNFPKRSIPCQPSTESDLEDYIVESDGENGASTSLLPQTGETGEPEPKRKKSCEQILDWVPKGPDDPPSFYDLGLRKPELLFVIDKDA
ncbi:unnamed protein product [Calicophoron daubneyi]|uniref:UBX domain-containing protein n=1 Tax=Calicophoron daubneyi TaxID=300641 RepID=A0AAV2TTD7_CALDB